ncbi:hypothetical protein ACFLYN_03750 [Chloroflexota bacterium]
MASRRIGNIRIFYSRKETATADLIADVCEKSLQLAGEDWGLDPPEDCRIYVMTSWLGFVFQSAPLKWRLMLAPTFPLWFPRMRSTWKYSAAWTQNYGSRIAIGIKPARLIEQSDRSIGVRMFVEETDTSLNVKHVTCHELVHACSAHLWLPTWLNEGIGSVTVDRYLGKQTIRDDTLQFIKDYLPKKEPPTYREMSSMSAKAIAYHGSRAYWLVRFLEEEFPGFLKEAFSEGMDSEEIVNEIAAELEIEPDNFWEEIDDIVADYFIGGE